ncbi:integrase [Paraburkholderia sp. GAS333]|uniref:integrase n=1 Tax=Paraburkholderia sp. GAS333 TaxID=3156279 RepID=UPI003D25AA6F
MTRRYEDVLMPASENSVILHPEFALLKWPTLERRLDVGQLCYLSRDTSSKRREHHTFDPESISVERISAVRTLIAHLSERSAIGAARPATAYEDGRCVVKFVNWCDKMEHHRCLCDKHETEVAIAAYFSALRERASQSKLSRNTVANEQRILLSIFRDLFDDDHFAVGLQTMRFRRSHVVSTEVPSSERQSLLLAWAEAIFAKISAHVLQYGRYPFAIHGAARETVWMLPTQYGSRRDGMSRGLRGWNLETGKLIPYKELAQQFKHEEKRFFRQAAQRVADAAKKQLAIANADARAPVRLTHAAIAAYAFALLFLAETGVNLSQLLAIEWSPELEESVYTPSVVRQKFREVKYRAGGAEFAFKVSVGFMPKLKTFLVLRKYLVQDKKVAELFIGTGLTRGLKSQFLTIFYKRLETLGITLPQLNSRKWRAAKQDWAITKHGPAVAASLLGHTLETALRSYSNGTDATQTSEVGALLAALEEVVLPAGKTAPKGVNNAVGICLKFQKPESIKSSAAVKADCRSSEGCLFCKQYRIHADAIDIRKLLSCRYCLRITYGLAGSLEQYESSFDAVHKRVQFLLDELKSHDKTLVDTIEHEVDVLGNLDAFWAAKLEQLLELGLA